MIRTKNAGISRLPQLMLTLFLLTLTTLVTFAQSGNGTVFLPIVFTKPLFADPLPYNLPPVTDVDHAGDDRIFIVERSGLVFILHPDGSSSTFLDLRHLVVATGAEQGMFNIAFHPDYANNGYFYLAYTTNSNAGDYLIRVSRFQVSADPNVADPNSEELVIATREQSPLHNGGGLGFNPVDGMLYFGVGDDQQLLVAQHHDTIKGKILRIDTSTHRSGTPQKWLDAQVNASVEIWALGFRNPWRFDFEPGSGGIFVADVGDELWEEVDIVVPGQQFQNFGWPCVEGYHVIIDFGECSNPERFIMPAFAYPHPEGCAIVGGEFHLPDGVPFEERAFIFGDVCSLAINKLMLVNGIWQAEQLGVLPSEALYLNTLGKDVHGNWYAGTFNSQPVYKLLIP